MYKESHRLNYRLLLAILLFSTVFTLVETGLQLYVDYRSDLKLIDKQLDLIQKSYVAPVTLSVWNFDRKQLELLLKGIKSLGNIQQVEVKDLKWTQNHLRSPESDPAVKYFPLTYFAHSEEKWDLGVMRIVIALDPIYQRLLDKILLILVTKSIKTFLISIFILLIFQYLITRHLNTIGNFTRQLRLGQLDQPLTLHRKITPDAPKDELDELDELVDAINSMRVQMREDLTMRQVMENDLRKSEERLAQFMDAVPVGVHIMDARKKTYYANTKAKEILGKSVIQRSDMAQLFKIRQPYFEGVTQAYPVEENPMMKALAGEQAHADDIAFCYENQTTSLELWSTPVFDKEHHIVYSVSAFWDISKQRQLTEERDKLSIAIEQAAEGIFITNSEGAIEYMNSSFEKISGYTFQELCGKNPRIFRSEKHPDKFYRNLWETIASGKVWTGEIINRNKNGALLTEMVTISPVKNKAGRIISYIAIVKDITHEKELEQHLRRSQRLESLGTLSGGIAHDFNNILQGIVLSLEMLKMKSPPDDVKIHNLIARASEYCKRGAQSVKQILTFSRQSSEEHSLIEINTVIKESIKMIKSILPKNINIKTHLDENGAKILGNYSQIYQVFMNICTNAVYAMRAGGDLTIRLVPVKLSHQEANLLHITLGDYIKLVISDTGPGMNATVKEQIFDPFFTTKPPGEGAGLGLSVAHGIVENHRGAITVKSEEGRGTTFEIFFPEVYVELPPVFIGNYRKATKGERILVIDDEDTITSVLQEGLKEIGYHVTIADNGKTALALIQQKKDAFDLVLTDQSMPEMTGEQLALILSQENPGLPVIIMSGYGTDIDKDQLWAKGVRDIISKPFELNNVVTLIRKILDA
ncbi:PAS domain S-box protein [Deltaproteobacteria bacterium TL4]